MAGTRRRLSLGSRRESDHLVPLLQTVRSDLVVLLGWKEMAAGRKWLCTALNGSGSRCACSDDVKRWSTHSRLRMGLWEFSARLLSHLWRRCSDVGSTRFSAGTWLASLSVMTTRGATPSAPSSTRCKEVSAAC